VVTGKRLTAACSLELIYQIYQLFNSVFLSRNKSANHELLAKRTILQPWIISQARRLLAKQVSCFRVLYAARVLLDS
jgi:hypothetical protein